MSPQVMGLVVGGLVPAVAYALFAIWTKSGSQAGIGAGPFMVLIGTACVQSAGWSFAAGVVWAAGTGLVSFALTRYGIPISKLNPIYNTNTLITVLLGLVVFSEWKQVNALQLLGGATLILVGSLLVSRA